MADGMVSIEIAAKLGEALRNFDALAAGVGKVVSKLDEANQKGKGTDDAGKKGADNFEKMASSAGRALIAITGIGTATAAFVKGLQLANAELDAITKRQASAAQHQVSLAGSTRSMIRNLGVGSDLTAPQAVAEVQKIALDTKASQDAVMQAASGVLSARGRFSAGEALGQLRATARLDPSMTGADLQTLAGSGLDIRKAFGGSAEQAIGLILAGQQTARVEDTAQFAKNAIPAALGLSQKMYGMKADQAFGLYAAFTQATGDKTGEQSKTSVLTFGQQIMKLPGMDGMSLDQRIAALRDDPKYARHKSMLFGSLGQLYGVDAAAMGRIRKGEKVDALHGEAAQLPAMFGILTPGSSVAAEYDAARRAMPTMEGAGAFYGQNVAMAQSVDLFTPARISEAARARVQQFQSDPNRAAAGAVMQAFETVLPESGIRSDIETKIRNKLSEVQLAGADQLQSVRIAQQTFGSAAEEAAGFWTTEKNSWGHVTDVWKTDRSRPGVAILEALRDEMKDLGDKIERNTTATQGNTNATGQPGAADRTLPPVGQPGVPVQPQAAGGAR